MYKEIINNISDDLSGKTIHLGIFSEPYLTYMLDGKKTIESRFSKKKILPYNKISEYDML